MEKKADAKKGISLRKRKTVNAKPVIGPPRQIPMPPMPGAKLPTGPASTPRIANRDRQKVADMVKRRMSTRYISIGESGDAPALPVMPDLSQLPGTLARKATMVAQGMDLDVDLDAFRDLGFNAEQYVQTILANATDAEIKEFLERLKISRRRTSSDLQKNVFVNRTQFILISKDIDKLKSEMRSLRSLLNDLHNTTSSLKIEPDIPGSAALTSPMSADMFLSAPSKARKAANRSSIADLTALHMTHLQTLWGQVEGAQKFLPAIPGRHILVESRDWLELNAATWKPRRQVHMVLLNDHLLLAAKKRKRVDPNKPIDPSRGGPMVKLVAERCWPLVEIEMVDLSPESKPTRGGSKAQSVSNAINIRVGKESFVFRNENKELKVKLLLAFKKTADELRKALRAESEDKHRMRDSLTYLTSRDPALLSQGELLKTLTQTMSKDQPSIIFHFDGQPRNLRWVENQMDELDMRIAHRRCEDAVAMLEKLGTLAKSALKNNVLAADLVTIKLDERALRLAGLITTELVSNISRASRVKETVSWLCRLGFEDRARETLLQAKSDVVRKMTRQVRFEGDIPSYISQIALVQFTLIRNTVEVFNACFDNRLSSALVKWAKEEVQGFVELLGRQLEGVEASGGKEKVVRKRCEEIVRGHKGMLVEVGLDLFRAVDGEEGKSMGEGLAEVGLGVGSGRGEKKGVVVGLGVR